MNTPTIAVPPSRIERWLLSGVVVVGLLVSFFIARDRLTWVLEVVWAVVGLVLVASKWKTFPLYLVLAACLSFSAFFELIEWWAALAYGADADAFLATQGDQWDTQWDMFLCLCGTIASLLIFSRWHDHQLGEAVLVGK